MHIEARQFTIKRRTDLHEDVYGEIYGGVEPGQLGVRQPVTTRGDMKYWVVALKCTPLFQLGGGCASLMMDAV